MACIFFHLSFLLAFLPFACPQIYWGSTCILREQRKGLGPPQGPWGAVLVLSCSGAVCGPAGTAGQAALFLKVNQPAASSLLPPPPWSPSETPFPFPQTGQPPGKLWCYDLSPQSLRHEKSRWSPGGSRHGPPGKGGSSAGSGALMTRVRASSGSARAPGADRASSGRGLLLPTALQPDQAQQGCYDGGSAEVFKRTKVLNFYDANFTYFYCFFFVSKISLPTPQMQISHFIIVFMYKPVISFELVFVYCER